MSDALLTYPNPARLRMSQPRKTDPSGTAGLARSYSQDAARRWRRVKRLITVTVVDNDALHLAEDQGPFGAADPVGSFPPERAQAAFTEWLRNALDDEVLEVVGIPGAAPVPGTHWADSYVRASYSRGVEHANEMLRLSGAEFEPEAVEALFNRPIHSSTLERLFSRNFSSLEGITEAASGEISTALAEGMSTGQAPRTVASAINGRVDSIGIARSRVLARTEIIGAHAESTLNRYQEFGVKEVVGQAEFLTAQDDRVCPDCDALEGNRFSLEEARGVIPVHPQCRCVWLPVVGSTRSNRERVKWAIRWGYLAPIGRN